MNPVKGILTDIRREQGDFPPALEWEKVRLS
jgi:hypothetical protein